MLITYKTVDLEQKSIDLKDALDVRIKGIQITECEEGIQVSVERSIIVKGVSSNVMTIFSD